MMWAYILSANLAIMNSGYSKRQFEKYKLTILQHQYNKATSAYFVILLEHNIPQDRQNV